MEHELTDKQALFLKNALYKDFERLDRKALTFVYSCEFKGGELRYLVSTDGYSIHALRFDGVPDGFYALEGNALRSVEGSEDWKYPDWERLMNRAIDELEPIRKIRTIALGFDAPLKSVTLLSNYQFVDTDRFDKAIALASSYQLFGDTDEYITSSTREIMITLKDGSMALVMPIDPRSM